MYYVKMEKKMQKGKGKSSGHSYAKMLLSWVKGENMWVLVIRYGPQAKFFPVFLGLVYFPALSVSHSVTKYRELNMRN